MLLPGVVPGMAIAVILVINGLLIFAVASIVLELEKMQKAAIAG